MHQLPHHLYRADQVRELDRIAIEEQGILAAVLMERAGAAAFDALRAHFSDARTIAVVCGPGNNGGDGYVIARLARAAGLSVTVHALQPTRGGAAAEAASRLRTSGASLAIYTGHALDGYDVIVDAIVGTGLDRELEGVYRDAVEAINASGSAVVAVDIPSGLHADSGRVLGVCVRADLTVTFIGLKQGMFTGAGRRHCGAIEYDSLGVPETVFARVDPAALRLSFDALKSLLGPRPADANKGDFGHVLVVGGDYGMMGAAVLAGEAALRTGAGLVTVATRAHHAAVVSASRPELMARGVEGAPDLAPLLERASVVAVGPGLGRSEWAQRLLGAVLESRLPLVADADALNLLAVEPINRDNWVITPHPGEAARMLQCAVADVERDRFRTVRDLQARHGGAVVLKGAGSLVCTPDGVIGVCDAGNPGMASGGMGDALTGVIAALMAQGVSLADAAGLGTVVHAEAGDRAAAQGERGLIASDLIAELRAVANPPRR
jgi:NAD(P)H-hydrate epimerase